MMRFIRKLNLALLLGHPLLGNKCTLFVLHYILNWAEICRRRCNVK